MSIINAYSILKFMGINICISYSFYKIINFTPITKTTKIMLLITSILLAVTQNILQTYTPLYIRIFLIYFFYSLILCKTSKLALKNTIIVLIISLALSYIINFISLWIVLLFIKLNPFHIIANDTTATFYSVCITFILVYMFFKIKRFKYGFPFIKIDFKDNYFDIFIILINAIIIFMYFIFRNINHDSIIYYIFVFALFTLITLVIIQKTFILYHKQKLQTQALKDYEHELEETKQKLATATEEKQKLVKSNHEFYHRQEALKKKLDDLMKYSALTTNTELSEDYGNILDRINELSDEYIAKTKVLPLLPKTHITEIDDMLSYMQSECDKNNIEFILKIECDINYIIENFITKSQLETLLGDLIRNAIIAINHTSNNFKSIMVVFGIKDNSYELCIYDSGIPFEISTILNLGLKPASTHESEGGTGIGLITTFETINSCTASFVINEITNNNYTKSLEIKFDSKNEYIIISNRSDDITSLNTSNRNIIIKG